jgi:ferredoxin-NADP reductase
MTVVLDQTVAVGDETSAVSEVRVIAATYLADGVLGLTLQSAVGDELPSWEPGAHVDLRLPSGKTRSYSLCGDPADRGRYDVAVLREDLGRGASVEIHEQQLVGRTLTMIGPRNLFPLVDAPEYVFVAGGIGLTPLLPMIRQLAAGPTPWTVYYLGRSLQTMALVDELATCAARSAGLGRVRVVARDESERLDLTAALAAVAPGTAIYCCGPDHLMAAVEETVAAAAATPGYQAEVYLERFGRPVLTPAPVTEAVEVPGGTETAIAEVDTAECDPDGPFEVELGVTGKTLTVGAGESILERVREVRSGLTFSCSDGYCGTCETRVLAGRPDHRDDVLTDEEKEASETMMICVGRSKSPRLVLDL